VADFLSARLSSIFTPSTMTDIAGQLGATVSSVSRALSLSAATAFSALASKAGDSEMMRQVVDMASRTPASELSSITAAQLDPSSSLMSAGRRFLSSLFGGSQNRVGDLIGREAGLGSNAAATMLTLGATSLMHFLGGAIRDQGMTAASFAGFLRSEAPAVRKTLAPSFENEFMRHIAGTETVRTIDVNPVIAQSVRKERSLFPWMVAAAALVAALWWGLRPKSIEMPTVPAVPEVGTSGTSSYTPPKPPADVITGLDTDRLLFDTGSATLPPESQARLREIAGILNAHPNAVVKIDGFTDDVGSPAGNLALSQKRAANVKAELEAMGVENGRLTSEGYGEERPIADNATEAGRAMNRRISMTVTQK
jgi:OmpA-OmpF porin, OOP family